MTAAPRTARRLSSALAPWEEASNNQQAGALLAIDHLDGRIRLDVLLLPGFDLFDVGIAQEIAAVFNGLSLDLRFDLQVRALGDAERLRSSCGIELAVGTAASWGPNLLVLGGATAMPCRDSPWLFGLRRAGYDSARVISDVNGTFALACAGLLDHQPAVAPWHAVPCWQYLAPKVRFMAGVWSTGRKFHTSVGGRALLDLLLTCLSRQFGRDAADAVARRMNVDAARVRTAGTVAQHDPMPAYCGAGLRKAIRLMRATLDEPLTIEQLCDGAGIGERSLQRLFRRHLRTTPLDYHRRCRLLHAREMLRLTPLTVTEIALAAGFQHPTRFAQAYARAFGCTPSRERQRPAENPPAL